MSDRTMDFCIAHRAEYLGGAGCAVWTATQEWGGIPTPCEVERGEWTATGGPVKGPGVDHPHLDDMWRHDPPLWKPCYVCGKPTCWVETDIGFKHPECDMYPTEEGTVRIILGVKTVECCCGDEECWVLDEEQRLLDEVMEDWGDA